MALEFREISKQVYGEVHIAPTNLVLQPGVFNILLGPTLAGKTSLMRLMAGLDKPSTGSVWFQGQDVTQVAIQKRNLAMVYQQFINFPGLSVFDNIASPLRVQKLPEAEIQQRVQRVAELLKLTPYLSRRPAELSGGQQQRTALARALVKEAELVLLDEPLVNLDYKLREELREELPRLFADSGATVVYATTEPLEALLLGGYTATLREGKITQYGPTHEVFRLPKDLETAKAFSDPPLNEISLQKDDAGFRMDNQTMVQLPRYEHLPNGTYTLGFRPHHLKLESAGSCLGLQGKVLVTELGGSESFVHMQADHHVWAAHIQGIHKFQPGDDITMYVSPSHCLMFAADGQRVAERN